MQSVLRAGFELVEVNLAPVWSERLLAEWAQHLRPGPTYLILRINLRGGYTPIGHDAPYYGEKLQRQDLDGKLAEDARLLEPTDAWVDYCVETIRAIAQGLDALLPHRIIGLRPELVGENFMRPIRLSSKGVQLAMDGATINSANPNGFWDDYSPNSIAHFCAWAGQQSLQPSCAAPTPAERNHGVLGANFLADVTPAFRDPVLFNQFLSLRRAELVDRLARAVKDISAGKALTMAFYGYLNALGWDLPGSGHLALAEVENSPNLDIVSGPYSYGLSRRLGNAMLPQGIARFSSHSSQAIYLRGRHQDLLVRRGSRVRGCSHSKW